MSKLFRRIAAILALCMVLTALPPVYRAAPAGTDFRTLLAAAEDGDTIPLSGTVFAGSQGDDAPLVIDKAVIIEGGTLTLWVGGVVLGADVTFRNVSLDFASNVRNAVAANGHKLTLDNVTAGNHSFNLFCGTLIGREYEEFTVPAPGARGEIVIRGNTSLQNKDTYGAGGIYAGNLSMGGMTEAENTTASDAPANEFDGEAVIAVESAAGRGALGQIYACGAQQRIPYGASGGKITQPDLEKYTVSGGVSVQLLGSTALGVRGAGQTAVTYRNSNHYQHILPLTGVSSLTVQSGQLALAAESSLREDADVSVVKGAALDLTELGRSLTVGSFTGGGSLILGDADPLIISGRVTGTTLVGVGSIGGGYSGSPVVKDHGYIEAPQSADGAFTLAPDRANPDMELVRQESGVWTAQADPNKAAPLLVERFQLEDVRAPLEASDDWPAIEIPRVTEFVQNDAVQIFENVPLSMYVNGEQAELTMDAEGSSVYQFHTARMRIMTAYEDILAVFFEDDVRVEGRYIIEVTIPGSSTASGEDLFAAAILTVGDPQPTAIPIPAARAGLRWTGEEQTGVEAGVGYTLTGHTGTDVGSYTAIAVLQAGFQWADGSSGDAQIPWRIDKAEGPAAPAALQAAAPTAADANDGRIIGTTAAMEYAGDAAFTDAADCAEGETTGLAAGLYYVRCRATATHEAGRAAAITVPACGAPTVTAISVSSTGHKTQYTVGDALDVAGLTIEAVYSDDTRQTVAVSADMVSGFDAARPAASQTLTIRYEGCSAVYTIQILHAHSWSDAWTHDEAHHWHDCAAADCPISEPAQKDGYAVHSFGDWIVDRPAAAFQNGSRRRTCEVCGLAVTETIPATGSSSGGSSGSTSSTVKHPDGSQTTTVTRSDGTVITTETAADGSTVRTTASPDGSSRVDIRRADGTTAAVTRDTAGRVAADVRLASARSGGVLPVPALPADGVTQVTVHTGATRRVTVSIPVQAPAPGIVAILVDADGTETLMKTSIVTEHGLTAALPDGATVKLADRTKQFADTGSHWAEDAIAFAASRELLTGTGDAAFSPNAAMTRAMLITALARLDGAELQGGATWYSAAVSWAADRGVSDGTAPAAPVTREQLAVMLYRYAGAPAVEAQTSAFPDAAQISPYARDAVHWAVENGILTGFVNGALAPTAQATRAQVAVMLARYAANVVNI